MSLSGNPWTCRCDDLTKRLHTFVMTNGHILKDLNQITCSGSNQPLNKWNPIDFCSTTSNQHLIVVIIILGSLGVLFGLLVIMYYKYQHQIKVWLFAHGILLCWVSEEDIDQDKVYDAFVSYAEGDYGFVVHTLLPELEKSFKICHHARDFIGGEWIADQIYQKVHQSRRTIIVLTEEFLNSIYGIHEFRTAHAQSIADNRARVIILIYGDMPPQEALSMYVQLCPQTPQYKVTVSVRAPKHHNTNLTVTMYVHPNTTVQSKQCLCTHSKNTNAQNNNTQYNNNARNNNIFNNAQNTNYNNAQNNNYNIDQPDRFLRPGTHVDATSG
uniref:Protein toll n=1 Tax=Cacopsylla melanoneura TaxID=428564 RepID=A0A8D9BU58_9HEMI